MINGMVVGLPRLLPRTKVVAVGGLNDFATSKRTAHIHTCLLKPNSVERETGVLEGVSRGYYRHLCRARHGRHDPTS